MEVERELKGDELVRLLDLDADLAAAVPDDELEVAKKNILARVERLEPGPWEGGDRGESECAGFLVLDGLLTRDVTFAGQLSREVLGPADVLRPWDVERDFMPPYSEVKWTVIIPAAVAVLDRRLLRLGARWPEFVEEIIRRTLHRSRWLAIRLAISSVTRIDKRLLLFFWHLAGRWGRVTPDGTVIWLPLTHEDLAAMVGARRPSVTTALKALRESGELEQGSDGWILRGDPPVGDE